MLTKTHCQFDVDYHNLQRLTDELILSVYPYQRIVAVLERFIAHQRFMELLQLLEKRSLVSQSLLTTMATEEDRHAELYLRIYRYTCSKRTQQPTPEEPVLRLLRDHVKKILLAELDYQEKKFSDVEPKFVKQINDIRTKANEVISKFREGLNYFRTNNLAIKNGGLVRGWFTKQGELEVFNLLDQAAKGDESAVVRVNQIIKHEETKAKIYNTFPFKEGLTGYANEFALKFDSEIGRAFKTLINNECLSDPKKFAYLLIDDFSFSLLFHLFKLNSIVDSFVTRYPATFFSIMCRYRDIELRELLEQERKDPASLAKQLNTLYSQFKNNYLYDGANLTSLNINHFESKSLSELHTPSRPASRQSAQNEPLTPSSEEFLRQKDKKPVAGQTNPVNLDKRFAAALSSQQGDYDVEPIDPGKQKGPAREQKSDAYRWDFLQAPQVPQPVAGFPAPRVPILTLASPLTSKVSNPSPQTFKLNPFSHFREKNAERKREYQMMDTDVQAAIHYLKQTYESKKPEAAGPIQPDLFFLPPGPLSKFSKSDKEDPLHTIRDLAMKNEGKIGFGSFNYNVGRDTLHWVSIFVYKPKDGPIQVLILDPAYELAEKETTLKKIEKRFKKSILGVEIIESPRVTQQINDSDCGYSSITNGEDLINKRLVTIEKGQMKFHAERLSINGAVIGDKPFDQILADNRRRIGGILSDKKYQGELPLMNNRGEIIPTQYNYERNIKIWENTIIAQTTSDFLYSRFLDAKDRLLQPVLEKDEGIPSEKHETVQAMYRKFRAENEAKFAEYEKAASELRSHIAYDSTVKQWTFDLVFRNMLRDTIQEYETKKRLQSKTHSSPMQGVASAQSSVPLSPAPGGSPIHSSQPLRISSDLFLSQLEAIMVVLEPLHKKAMGSSTLDGKLRSTIEGLYNIINRSITWVSGLHNDEEILKQLIYLTREHFYQILTHGERPSSKPDDFPYDWANGTLASIIKIPLARMLGISEETIRKLDTDQIVNHYDAREASTKSNKGYYFLLEEIKSKIRSFPTFDKGIVDQTEPVPAQSPKLSS